MAINLRKKFWTSKLVRNSKIMAKIAYQEHYNTMRKLGLKPYFF